MSERQLQKFQRQTEIDVNQLVDLIPNRVQIGGCTGGGLMHNSYLWSFFTEKDECHKIEKKGTLNNYNYRQGDGSLASFSSWAEKLFGF
jgi:hypothetical protein